MDWRVVDVDATQGYQQALVDLILGRRGNHAQRILN